MTGLPILRTVAVAASAALLVAAFAAPAVAGKPKCGGQVATHVGTARGEVIRGTAKADVIVARGGHDIIYGRGGRDLICGNGGNDRIVGGAGNDFLLGKTGHDKLYGGAGRDLLVGGPGNDRLVGGPGNDGCLQGSGTGLRVACERPAVKVVLPPPPPPPAPTLIPLTGILAVAYSDIDGLDGYSTGDVMISKIVDTNRDGKVSEGDTIIMGQYPTRLDASLFGDWDDKSHPVTYVREMDGSHVAVSGDSGKEFRWRQEREVEWYEESWGSSTSYIFDGLAASYRDVIDLAVGSASGPEKVDLRGDNTADEPFIDVNLLYGGFIL